MFDHDNQLYQKYKNACVIQDIDENHELIIRENEENCYTEKVLKEDFEQLYYEIFGNKEINYEDFNIYEKFCKLDNKYIICNSNRFLDDTSWQTYMQYKDDIKENDEIIITVQYFKILEPNEIFNDPEKKNIIGYLPDDKTKYKDDELIEYVLNNYEDKVGVFIVTFKKNETNGYYWYSSEYVE